MRARLFGVLFCLLLGATLEAKNSQPIEWLKRVLSNHKGTAVSAILVQRGYRGKPEKVLVEETSTGHLHHVRMEERHGSHMEMIDDGLHRVTYMPWRNQVMVGESEVLRATLSESRMQAILRNYSLSVVNSGDLAGRATICVTATPKHPELYTKRFFIDRATGYPLRREFQEAGNLSTIEMEVLRISYPKKIAEPNSKLLLSKAPNIGDDWKICTEDAAEQILGFRPLALSSETLGFYQLKLEVREKSPWQSACLQLVDGLNKIKLYEWQDNPRQKSPPDSIVREGIRVLLVGDLPAEAKSQILDALR